MVKNYFLCEIPFSKQLPFSFNSVIADMGDNIFLTLARQFPVAFYIGFSVGLTPYN